MLAMSLGFERTSEKRLKSKVNLQSGSFRLEYIDDEDKDTRTSMKCSAVSRSASRYSRTRQAHTRSTRA